MDFRPEGPILVDFLARSADFSTHIQWRQGDTAQLNIHIQWSTSPVHRSVLPSDFGGGWVGGRWNGTPPRYPMRYHAERGTGSKRVPGATR